MQIRVADKPEPEPEPEPQLKPQPPEGIVDAATRARLAAKYDLEPEFDADELDTAARY
eukprot:SAG11_NODE_29768_length_307_cov_1.182692_1_plen_57_part_10